MQVCKVMLITKLGHCCLLINHKNLTILTDPGNFTTAQDTIKGIDIVLITHEHADHLHVPSVEAILKNNPEAKIITNAAVAKILSEKNIAHQIMQHNQTQTINEIVIQAIDGKHEIIYPGFGDVQNTGFLLDQELFYPGDSYIIPSKPVKILALPVAGPWCKVHDAIDYALKVKPKIAFPVHDGQLRVVGGNHRVPQLILEKNGIAFVVIADGQKKEF